MYSFPLKKKESNVNNPGITDLSDHRVMSEDGRQLASKHGVDFFEGSAKEGHGITEAFIQLSRLVLKAQQQHSNQGNLLKGIDNKTVRKQGISICLQMFSSQ